MVIRHPSAGPFGPWYRSTLPPATRSNLVRSRWDHWDLRSDLRFQLDCTGGLPASPRSGIPCGTDPHKPVRSSLRPAHIAGQETETGECTVHSTDIGSGSGPWSSVHERLSLCRPRRGSLSPSGQLRRQRNAGKSRVRSWGGWGGVRWSTTGPPRDDHGINIAEEIDHRDREENRTDQRQDLPLRPSGPTSNRPGDRLSDLSGRAGQTGLPHRHEVPSRHL